VDAIAPNDDFTWSAFANEIPFLNPDDLDGPTAVARIVVVQYLPGVQHFTPPAPNNDLGLGRSAFYFVISPA
jgi:hypothetical protein